jgi:hypothetical protein
VAPSIFVVLTNPVAGREDEYNQWYSTTHVSEVCAIEGFKGATRYRLAEAPADQAGPDGFGYLCVYEFEADADPEDVLARLSAAAQAGTLARSEALSLDPPPRTFVYDAIP